MKQIKDGLFMLSGFPPNAINVYLAGDVLIDAASRWAKGRIIRQLAGPTVTAHAITHAHPDHQGASHAVCQALDVPLWCSEADKLATETGDLSGAMPPGAMGAFSRATWAGPGHPVARTLAEGDQIGGFKVIETPGHSPGHLSFWRESDRVLIAGDVIFNMSMVTGLPGLHTPPDFFTVDPAQNRESARKLAALQPETICFGHGPVMTDGKKFTAFINSLT